MAGTIQTEPFGEPAMSSADLPTYEVSPTRPPEQSLTPQTKPPEPGDLVSPVPAILPPLVDTPLAPTVPGYEIVGELGHGGMGVVYKARHLGLNRVVALKMIRSAEYASPDE